MFYSLVFAVRNSLLRLLGLIGLVCCVGVWVLWFDRKIIVWLLVCDVVVRVLSVFWIVVRWVSVLVRIVIVVWLMLRVVRVFVIWLVLWVVLGRL